MKRKLTRRERRAMDRKTLRGKSASLGASKSLLSARPGILQSPKLIIPGETLTDNETFVCSIHCRQCGECLKEGDPQPAREFLQSWGSIFATKSKAAALVQRSKNCFCWDSEKGTGAPIGVKVFARTIQKFVNIIMRDPDNKDYTIEKVEVIKKSNA